jgi:hypothetical protein
VASQHRSELRSGARICGRWCAVRNSNDPDAGTLHFTGAEIAVWIAGCKVSEFDDLTA